MSEESRIAEIQAIKGTLSHEDRVRIEAELTRLLVRIAAREYVPSFPQPSAETV